MCAKKKSRSGGTFHQNQVSRIPSGLCAISSATTANAPSTKQAVNINNIPWADERLRRGGNGQPKGKISTIVCAWFARGMGRSPSNRSPYPCPNPNPGPHRYPTLNNHPSYFPRGHTQRKVRACMASYPANLEGLELGREQGSEMKLQCSEMQLAVPYRNT